MHAQRAAAAVRPRGHRGEPPAVCIRMLTPHEQLRHVLNLPIATTPTPAFDEQVRGTRSVCPCV